MIDIFNDFNYTNLTTPPTWLLKRIHAQIIAYMLNRSATEGRYWETQTRLEESVSIEPPTENLGLHEDWRAALTSAFSFNIAISIIGNLVVLLVLVFGRSKSDLNIFLINLALADLTMAIFCMPFTFTTIMYGHWIFGAGMCPTVIFLQQVSVIVSIYTLTAIGIDRYFAVIYPLKIRVTKHRSKILLGSIIVLAVTLAVVQTAFTHIRRSSHDGQGIYFCQEWSPSNNFLEAYEVFIVMTTYFIPLVVLMFTYVRIGRKLWGRIIPGNADRSRDKSHASSKKKVIKMLIVVVVMFAVCWLPLHIFNLVAKFNPIVYHVEDLEAQDRIRKINACVLWLAMSNSFMNPIIYSFMNDGFRADLKYMYTYSICQCKRPQKQVYFTSSRRERRTRSLYSTSTSFLTNTKLNRVLAPKKQQVEVETVPQELMTQHAD
ncbi:prolactin-releasing peptide receptor-like [Glandiceps talaboti]